MKLNNVGEKHEVDSFIRETQLKPVVSGLNEPNRVGCSVIIMIHHQKPDRSDGSLNRRQRLMKCNYFTAAVCLTRLK